MFEAAENEFAALKGAIAELTQVVAGLAQTVTAQNTVLADLRRQLAAIESALPAPVPNPPPAPEPGPTAPNRDESAIRAVITEEMDRRTTTVLTDSQMADWIAHFSKPEFASLSADDFRAEVADQVEKDIVKYGFPRRALVLTGTAGMP